MKNREGELEGALALAERELTFLTEHLEEFPEIAATSAGALLLSCLEGGMTMASRLHELHRVSAESKLP